MNQKLLEAEAKNKGISTDKLLKQEVDSKVAEPIDGVIGVVKHITYVGGDLSPIVPVVPSTRLRRMHRCVRAGHGDRHPVVEPARAA